MASGVISRGNNPRLLLEGVRKIWGQAYNKYPDQYVKLFEVVKSKKAFELDVQFEGFGLAPVKPEGQGIEYDSQQQGFVSNYTPLTYAKGFIVTEENIEDELYGVFSKKARALGFSMRQTVETVSANVYNRAFNNAYTMNGGDGVALLSASHINGPTDSRTFSNILLTPAALSETAIEQLTINIKQATDPRGLRISLLPEALIVPSYLEYEATRIMKSVLQNDTANNALNALKETNAIRNGIVVNNYLSSQTAYFIRTSSPDGMVFINRKEAVFNQDNDFDTSNARFKSSMRLYPGWTDPRGLYGSAGV